jgi:hypothetical protein
MKLTEPLPDTEQNLFYTAINALRIAGQEKIADDLEERLEAIAKTPTIAIFVEGGIIQGVRSNIGQDLQVDVIDADNEPDTAEEQWMELQEKLEFGNL